MAYDETLWCEKDVKEREGEAGGCCCTSVLTITGPEPSEMNCFSQLLLFDSYTIRFKYILI